MNRRIASLLKRHSYSLTEKGIDFPSDLLQVIRLDLLKAFFVLVEINQRTAVDVLNEFFAEQPDIVPKILPKIDQPWLHHLGFEVHEPHDLVLPGFYRWLPQFSNWLSVPLQINGTLRFPSSVAFQERVGVYTEMMQIWVGLEDRELLIEMFDIYRPRPFSWASVKQTYNFRMWQDWCRTFNNDKHRGKLPALLAGDEIWHYGIHISDPAAIEALHNDLKRLTGDHEAYKLAYDQPVLNLRDTSLHTKIINKKLGLEIEFLTQNLPLTGKS